MNLYLKMIMLLKKAPFLFLFALVYSIFSAERFVFIHNVFLLDVLLVFYVLLSAGSHVLKYRSLRLLRFSGNFILFLFFSLLPSLFLLLFSNNIEYSLQFLVQYYFIFLLLPLFCNYLIVNDHLIIFLKLIFFGFFVVSIAYVYTLFNSDMLWSDFFYSSTGKEFFGARFFLGEFTPNEMGHYFVLFILSLMVIDRSTIFFRIKKMVLVNTIITLFLTLSKTVWLQLIIFYFLKVGLKVKILILVAIVFLFPVLFYFFKEYFSFFDDFSPEKYSNKIRVLMFYDSIRYIPYSILQPAFHYPGNLALEDLRVTSAHNGILSFINNFGLISFLFISLGATFFLISKLNKRNLFFLLLIFIDLIVLFFNPLINSRILWLPMFLLIFIFYYNDAYDLLNQRSGNEK